MQSGRGGLDACASCAPPSWSPYWRRPGAPVPEGIAVALIRANRARIGLTREQARSPSLAEMRSFDARHRAADAAVELHVKAIRNVLGLPPPPD